MADVKNYDGALLVIDFVHYTVVTHTDAPSFPGGKFEASARPRILSEGANRVADTLVGLSGQLRQLLLCSAQN
jgi:hypothetical protein